jgi:hypothetical protein
MRTLIVKLNATGDVVRTTALLRGLQGEVTWITAAGNAPLLTGLERRVRCLPWERRHEAADAPYDLVINLEDELDTAQFVAAIPHARLFGAVLKGSGVAYTPDAHKWFDMSLISVHGKVRADRLKYENRSSYQSLIFEGLGLSFSGQQYVLPSPTPTDLAGDVAIAPVAGPVWPMKAWAHYDELKRLLEADGLSVNILPKRATLLEHLGDISNHRCLVSGDSLPMHLALGLGVRCVTLFNCTSPWEIHDYGLQTKLVSPLLAEFFYSRAYDPRAVNAISLSSAYSAVKAWL